MLGPLERVHGISVFYWLLRSVLAAVGVSLVIQVSWANSLCRGLYTNRGPIGELRFEFLGDESKPRETRVVPRAEILRFHERVQEAMLIAGRDELPDLVHFDFYGEPLPHRLGSGFQITNFGYYEATRKTSARGAIRGILDYFDLLPSQIRVLEPFGGIGHAAHHFASRGLSVETYELDPLTHRVGTNNLRRAGTLPDLDYLLGDGVEAMRNHVRQMGQNRRNRPFDVVYLDPPWLHGVESRRLHVLDQFAVSLRRLIPMAYIIADLIVIKRQGRSEFQLDNWRAWAVEHGFDMWVSEGGSNILLAPKKGTRPLRNR